MIDEKGKEVPLFYFLSQHYPDLFETYETEFFYEGGFSDEGLKAQVLKIKKPRGAAAELGFVLHPERYVGARVNSGRTPGVWTPEVVYRVKK